MRIAQVSPLYESVPPKQYGGTERVVSYLTEELVALGHEVTLFASGDSETSAKLVPCSPQALWATDARGDGLAHHVRMLEEVFRDVSRFDVIHFHTENLHYPLVRRNPCCNVTTLHGQMFEADHKPFYEEFHEMPLVSISDEQRTPVPFANWQATVYHGLPPELTFRDQPGEYLAFLGRVAPEKGVDQAIAIACKVGMKLKIAAVVHPEGRRYFQEVIEPMVKENPDLIEFIGEVGGQEKDAFLGNARALLFPIDWREPFGLVMIEAMACGTPVIAYPRGSVPEVIEHGRSGFLVENTEQAAEAIGNLHQLRRADIRQAFDERFTATRMARDYLDVYRRLLGKSREHPVIAKPNRVLVPDLAKQNLEAISQGPVS